jgi:hypothetical protein
MWENVWWLLGVFPLPHSMYGRGRHGGHQMFSPYHIRCKQGKCMVPRCFPRHRFCLFGGKCLTVAKHFSFTYIKHDKKKMPCGHHAFSLKFVLIVWKKTFSNYHVFFQNLFCIHENMEKIHVIYLQINELGMVNKDLFYFNSHVDVDSVPALCISMFEE